MVADTHTLPVFFTTQTPYPLPSQKFMIPAAWKRYQLSQLVNKALSLAQPVPFDFLVQGELLRGTLAEWCNERGVGTEETLEIEYIESLMPPKRMASMPHEDWVSSVSCQIPGHFVTASYDGLIRVFDSSQALTHTVSGHTAPITSVCVVSLSSNSSTDESTLASASHDMTAHLSSVSLGSSSRPSQQPQKCRTLATLHLHTSPLSSVAASPSGTHLLTAGWDALVGFWDTQIPSSDEVPTEVEERSLKKRRRVAESSEDGAPKRKSPSAVLKSHTGRVMAAIFEAQNEKRAYSCGLDSTIRCWDLEGGVCINTLTAPEKPFLSITLLQSSSSLLAAASTDRTVTIYDTRSLSSPRTSSTTTTTVASLFHPTTPAALAPSPSNAHHLATGSYDGVVRVWDVRSTKSAMASFRVGEGDLHVGETKAKGDGKILGLDWARGLLAVGGEAGLDVWKVPEEAASTS